MQLWMDASCIIATNQTICLLAVKKMKAECSPAPHTPVDSVCIHIIHTWQYMLIEMFNGHCRKKTRPLYNNYIMV